MKSSQEKTDLSLKIVPQMSKCQVLLKLLRKLGLRSPYNYDTPGMRELRRWAERTYPHN